MTPFLLFLSLGTTEMIIIGVVGLLLFGRRLPEVGRSLGRSLVEFKSGLEDLKGEMTEVERMTDEAAERPRLERTEEEEEEEREEKKVEEK